MYTSILWATDASPEADEALCEALDLLEPGGKLVAVHCDQRFVGGRVGGVSILPDELDRRHHIGQQVEELRNRGIVVEERIETTHTDPAHEIAKVAEELDVELIVCGTRSLHGLPALLNGSVAAHLLKYAPVPVVVVPMGTRTAAAAAAR
jgi:nucleotide-binding universal stress UspA family protein